MSSENSGTTRTRYRVHRIPIMAYRITRTEIIPGRFPRRVPAVDAVTHAPVAFGTRCVIADTDPSATGRGNAKRISSSPHRTFPGDNTTRPVRVCQTACVTCLLPACSATSVFRQRFLRLPCTVAVLVQRLYFPARRAICRATNSCRHGIWLPAFFPRRNQNTLSTVLGLLIRTSPYRVVRAYLFQDPCHTDTPADKTNHDLYRSTRGQIQMLGRVCTL